ncbi:vanillate O-demethylase ferredoxin subunit [Herbaspirillum sp. Sphag1AN]|uniref:PDR/VanB family oxidoreductase n=1 Tax=unclassified Herbaspirillum TaxID=2624150 RepID=UPI001618D537|nr:MULTISPECIES: PDR/VanB family oxidoreductase [unclassified Herbaspirillum]MBB3213032.1 vanillate O-demethylase ferredoxin subunit [Herbaspirillum sp. Sphag1AN]MBB3246229.1 vanillate O-demethylase ferredoxin subunit [Herbaspirillum sp. Sphag64]
MLTLTASSTAFSSAINADSSSPARSSPIPSVVPSFVPSPGRLRLSLQVSTIREDGHLIRVIELRANSRQRLPDWSPGAHVQLLLPNGLSRCYSLCNAPDEDDVYRIAVKRELNSRGGSDWLHTHLHVGDRLTLMAPVNFFPLQESVHTPVLFAAGIGITPIYSMAAALAARGQASELHYFARSAGHATLLGPLSQTPMASHCHYYFGLDTGDIEVRLLATLQSLSVVTPLYVCGPAPFIALLRTQANQLGWRDEDIHFELFGASPVKPETPQEKIVDGSFELILQRSGVYCRVAPGQSIVAAAATAGVHIGTSCGEGFCGSCQSRVIAGEVDHRDSVLTAAQRASHQLLMPCVSRCAGERLVLDL